MAGPSKTFNDGPKCRYPMEFSTPSAREFRRSAIPGYRPAPAGRRRAGFSRDKAPLWRIMDSFPARAAVQARKRIMLALLDRADAAEDDKSHHEP
jgi:hypothetical protein